MHTHLQDELSEQRWQCSAGFGREDLAHQCLKAKLQPFGIITLQQRNHVLTDAHVRVNLTVAAHNQVMLVDFLQER